MADAERIDEAVERDPAPRLDRREQIAHRGLAVALASSACSRRAVALLQREDVGRLHHQAVARRKHSICFSPSPSMSKARRETKCLQPLDRLRRADQPAGAARAPPRRLLAHRMAAADRACRRETDRASRSFGRLSSTTSTTCGITSPARWMMTVSPIADIDALADRLAVVADALDVILVVQRGVLHHDAADRDRLEPRHRRQRAGAADLDVDAVAARSSPARPANLCAIAQRGAARHEAEPLLPVEPVDLVDHAVDVVAERGALLLDLAIESRAASSTRLAQLDQRIDRRSRSRSSQSHHAVTAYLPACSLISPQA